MVGAAAAPVVVVAGGEVVVGGAPAVVPVDATELLECGVASAAALPAFVGVIPRLMTALGTRRGFTPAALGTPCGGLGIDGPCADWLGSD